MKHSWLPLTAEDAALARQVNERLAHARVTPYRRDGGDEQIIYGMVLEYFEARKAVEREYPFFDAAELVKLIETWINDELTRYKQMDSWIIAR